MESGFHTLQQALHESVIVFVGSPQLPFRYAAEVAAGLFMDSLLDGDISMEFNGFQWIAVDFSGSCLLTT